MTGANAPNTVSQARSPAGCGWGGRPRRKQQGHAGEAGEAGGRVGAGRPAGWRWCNLLAVVVLRRALLGLLLAAPPAPALPTHRADAGAGVPALGGLPPPRVCALGAAPVHDQGAQVLKEEGAGDSQRDHSVALPCAGKCPQVRSVQEVRRGGSQLTANRARTVTRDAQRKNRARERAATRARPQRSGAHRPAPRRPAGTLSCPLGCCSAAGRVHATPATVEGGGWEGVGWAARPRRSTAGRTQHRPAAQL
mgnify:CR=1 FL=1